MRPDDLTDAVNPILLKEIRQLFHNRGILLLLSLLLLGELAIMLIGSADYNRSIERGITSIETGQELFYLQCVCAGALFLFICVLRSASLFNSERMDKDLDYSRLSVLPAASIAFGKIASCLAMMVFILSMMMPFMMIAYYMGGISFSEIFSVIAFMVLWALLMSQAGLLLGSFGKKNMLSLIVLLSTVLIPIPFTLFAWLLDSKHDRLPILGLVVMCFIQLFVQLFLWTVASIRRGSGNVMRHPRICLFASMVVTQAMVFAIYAFLGRGSAKDVCQFAWWMLFGEMTLLHLVLVFEEPVPGTRILQERSGSKLLRAIGIPFASGQCGAIALSILLHVIWYLAIMALVKYSGKTGSSLMMTGGRSEGEDALAMLTGSLYVLFYSLIAVNLQNWFSFARRNKSLSLGLSLGVLFVLPLVIALCVGIGDGDYELVWMCLLTTPFCCNHSRMPYGIDSFDLLILASSLCLLSFLPLLPKVIRGFRDYVFRENGEVK